jgi:hypothetical protein
MESPAQAATDRRSQAGAEPDVERPAAVRILVDLPQPRTHPKGCHRPPALDPPGVSSSPGPSQVPPAVFIDAPPQEARNAGAESSAHPGHRRTQVTRSPVRLPADRADHLPDVRGRQRPQRRVPGAVDTLSPHPGRNWTLSLLKRSFVLQSLHLQRTKNRLLGDAPSADFRPS